MRFHKGFTIGNESDDFNQGADEQNDRLPRLVGGKNSTTSVFSLGVCNKDMKKLATYKLDGMDRHLIKSTFLDYDRAYEKELEQIRYDQRLNEMQRVMEEQERLGGGPPPGPTNKKIKKGKTGR